MVIRNEGVFHVSQISQSAGAVEYTDSISAEGYPPNESPVYDTKQSDS